jgi:hypothetical protein
MVIKDGNGNSSIYAHFSLSMFFPTEISVYKGFPNQLKLYPIYPILFPLPSGKHTKNYGKSQCLMGKSTINGNFQ